MTTGTLKWEESGEPMDELLTEPLPFERILGRNATTKARTNYDMLSVREEYESYLGKDRMERSFICSGKTRIKIPEGATVLMNTPAAPFVAYYHHDERFGGNVGYLRIPHYFPRTPEGEFAFEERFKQYQFAVKALQENTVGLIIDQDHNCGGSVTYLEEMLGLFMNGRYQPQMFRLLASKESLIDFQEWVSETPNFTEERADLDKVIALVKAAYELGEEFLSPMTSITGKEWYRVNEVNYTKPIIVLIDELSGSGGDAFPSQMGHTRAKLLGKTTSGLGGHVQEISVLPYSRITGRYTKSLFFRPDGVAVENNGAFPAPGFEYTISRNDFMNEYQEYQAFYLRKLLEMVQAAR